MRGIVDRIEGEYAVCQVDGAKMEQIPLAWFAEPPKDGDVVEIACGSAAVLKEETADRKKEMRALFDKLRRTDG